MSTTVKALGGVHPAKMAPSGLNESADTAGAHGNNLMRNF
jgi:hypothetical protein